MVVIRKNNFKFFQAQIILLNRSHFFTEFDFGYTRRNLLKLPFSASAVSRGHVTLPHQTARGAAAGILGPHHTAQPCTQLELNRSIFGVEGALAVSCW